MSELGIPIGTEKSEINNSLNTFVLLVFLMGIYTVVYFGTIYLYLSRNSSKRRIVPAAITVLYISSIVQTGIQWYATKWQFVDNGDTRDSIFVSLYANPQWLYLVFEIASYIIFVIADGLLIWRCYFVWSRSFRVISVSLFLVVIEAGMFLVEIISHAILTNKTVSQATAATFNHLLSAAFFVSFSSTLITTILIAYRIYSVLKQEGVSARRFKHVLDIVVQSGAVYSLSLLTMAISMVVPGADNILSPWNVAFYDYIQNLNLIVSGMSATVMVARVALLSADTTFPSTSGALSGLQFHSPSTRPTINVEGIEITHCVDADINSAGKGQTVEGKVQ